MPAASFHIYRIQLIVKISELDLKPVFCCFFFFCCSTEWSSWTEATFLKWTLQLTSSLSGDSSTGCAGKLGWSKVTVVLLTVEHERMSHLICVALKHTSNLTIPSFVAARTPPHKGIVSKSPEWQRLQSLFVDFEHRCALLDLRWWAWRKLLWMVGTLQAINIVHRAVEPVYSMKGFSQELEWKSGTNLKNFILFLNGSCTIFVVFVSVKHMTYFLMLSQAFTLMFTLIFILVYQERGSFVIVNW